MMMAGEYHMNRIGRMITGIQQAKDGNYAVRLETSDRNDELDLLTEAINQLLDQVEESHAACEQTKEALRETQERFRRLEANIPGMVYTYQLEADGRNTTRSDLTVHWVIGHPHPRPYRRFPEILATLSSARISGLT